MDFRSRAGTTVAVIKSWDFATDGNTEGWNATNMTGFTTKSGLLDGVVGGDTTGLTTKEVKIPFIANTAVALSTKENVRYAFGNKSIKIRMAVTTGICRGTAYVQEEGQESSLPRCPGGNDPITFPFEISVITPLRAAEFDKTFQKVVGDGVMHEYEFIIPESLPITSIQGISIKFTGLMGKAGSVVKIDYIQVVARQFIKPTPKPEPGACGLKNNGCSGSCTSGSTCKLVTQGGTAACTCVTNPIPKATKPVVDCTWKGAKCSGSCGTGSTCIQSGTNSCSCRNLNLTPTKRIPTPITRWQ